jgi:hypothetical protein
MVSSLVMAAPVFAAPELVTNDASANVEIPVEQVLSPAFGFDDNDQVMVVLHGWLPNACYSLADSRVEREADSHRMKIHQFATLRGDGICATDSGTPGKKMPEHLLLAVPFNQEVPIGRLPVGDYQFQIESRQSTPMRALTVSKALTPSVDSLPYAMVSGASVADITQAGKEVEVTVSGLLNSTCTEVADEIEVKKVGDVFVVLPTLRVKEGACAQVLLPFERKVKLGKPEAGRYLVHVRSMNGRAVNKVIEVQK